MIEDKTDAFKPTKFKPKSSLKAFKNNPHYEYLFQITNLLTLHNASPTQLEYFNALFEDLELIKVNKSKIKESSSNYLLEIAKKRTGKFSKLYIYLFLNFIDKENDHDGNIDDELTITIRFLRFLWRKYWVPYIKHSYIFLQGFKRNINDFTTFNLTKKIVDISEYKRKIEFNRIIKNSLKYQNSNYPPNELISLVHAYIDVIKLCYPDPDFILNAIMEDRDDADSNEKNTERTHLLYWLLLAMKECIGFEDFPKDFTYSLYIVFDTLETEAKFRNYLPDYNHLTTLFQTPRNGTSQTQHPNEILESPFKLTKKLSKADLVRILDTIYTGGYIETNGESKMTFMVQAGSLFGENLENFAESIRINKGKDFKFHKIFESLSEDCQRIFENRSSDDPNKK